MANQSITVGGPISVETPRVRHIEIADLGTALALGWRDFWANPTHLVFLGLIYPILGMVLGRMASGYDALPLVYPLISGFALIGPFAAVVLYEVSRQRERGGAVSAWAGLDVFKSSRLRPIIMLGIVLTALFVGWMIAAQVIYDATLGESGAAATIAGFVQAVLTTSAGWSLIAIGSLVGFVFALVVLTISVVSFPLLIDRQLSADSVLQVIAAVQTSVRAVLANPVPMACWGLIVTALLVVGSLPLLVGLAVVMPVLGHATWHLYRKVVV